MEEPAVEAFSGSKQIGGCRVEAAASPEPAAAWSKMRGKQVRLQGINFL